MKITDIRIYVVKAPASADGWIGSRNYIFIKVITDEGIHGWGEAFVLNNQERSIAKLIEELADTLKGSNPLNVKSFIRGAIENFGERRPNLTLYIAISALEIALWDIAGKSCGVPVCQLLGGAFSKKVRLYANFWSRIDHPVDEIVKKALEFKQTGYCAVKIYPMRYASNDAAEDLVQKVRGAIGYDIDLMIDMSGHPDPVEAMQAAQRFVPYQPGWIEEPVIHHDLENLAIFTRELPVPVVTGEKLAGIEAFRQLILAKAGNTLNPDISTCGGIMTSLDIAMMADAFNIQITPHNYGSMVVAQAAMLHVAALSSNCEIAEYFPYFQEFSDLISTKGLHIDRGFALVPDEPGLGIDLDEGVLQKFLLDQ